MGRAARAAVFLKKNASQSLVIFGFFVLSVANFSTYN